ncbi:MAG: NADPH-dependent 7-cyano-7-deazaguanine reductase QueF, partial [Legionellaceae bacterium]
MNNIVDQQAQGQPEASELGQASNYDPHYNPGRLFAISRAGKRSELGIEPNQLPFYGVDCWNHYEVSWLNEQGKPLVAVAEILYDCATPYLVESKSLKLYFNSFNNTPFKSIDEVRQTVARDLSACLKGDVFVNILPLRSRELLPIQSSFIGESIDELDVACTSYVVNPAYLTVGAARVDEILCSDLLKSNCLVTHQPDWGSVQIAYKGPQINREGLLKYLVSFRNHNEFHEQCIERIFVDILNRCQPEE